MKSIMLTGATKGLGLALAQSLVNETYRIICVGRTPSPEFTNLLEQHSDRIEFYSFDLYEIRKIGQLIIDITNTHGPLYGLINNAGVGLDGVLATQHLSDIENVLKLNLEAPIVLSKYACRSMLVNMQGRIINISSIIATTGYSGLAAYGASKAGFNGFTRSLSRELGRANITVNCIAPGFMETDMTAGLDNNKMQSIKRRSPLGLPDTVDVVGAVKFLLSDEAAKITGANITVDGGNSA